MSTLVVVRHGQSLGNERNEFTGWKDAPLTRLGRKESQVAGIKLSERGLLFDHAFCSNLSRAVDTCGLILAETNSTFVAPVRTNALNERDYGELTGLNRDEARAKWGMIWCMLGGAPTPCHHQGAKVSATPARGSCPFSYAKSCLDYYKEGPF